MDWCLAASATLRALWDAGFVARGGVGSAGYRAGEGLAGERAVRGS